MLSAKSSRAVPATHPDAMEHPADARISFVPFSSTRCRVSANWCMPLVDAMHSTLEEFQRTASAEWRAIEITLLHCGGGAGTAAQRLAMVLLSLSRGQNPCQYRRAARRPTAQRGPLVVKITIILAAVGCLLSHLPPRAKLQRSRVGT